MFLQYAPQLLMGHNETFQNVVFKISVITHLGRPTFSKTQSNLDFSNSMQMVGGCLGAFDLWEAAILPALMYNSETWTDIKPETVKDLEEMQCYLF